MKRKKVIKRSNQTIIKIVMINITCGFLLILNILYTMTFRVHFRSKENVMNYAYGSETSKILRAQRGKIMDRNGEIIAQDIDTYTIVAYLDKSRKTVNNQPAYVVDANDTAEKLSPILEMSKEDILGILENAQANNSYQTNFGIKGKNLSTTQKEAIDALEIPGIEFEPSLDRYYPIGKFASHLIGYAKYHEAEKKIVGEMGAETYLNEYLSGEDGEERYQATANNTALPGTRHVTKPVKNGYDVYLTLDKNVQVALETLLQKTMDEFHAKRAWALMMEVETGKILGWSSYPTFDLNQKDIQEWINVPSMWQYEPGSVMKAITYAAAIDTGNYPENQTFVSGTFNLGIDENGQAYRANTYTKEYGKIQEAEGKDHGTITFDEGFKLSSNIAICELLTRYLPTSDFEKYLDKFGFFQPVNMKFIQESFGKKTYQYPIEKLTTGFGQGSSVTAIQMMQAYTAILNDGKMMQPYYVEKIVDSQNQEVIEQFSPEVKAEPIRKETADRVIDLMNLVMNEPGGTGYTRYRMDDVRVIGKTGTGQISQNGSYSNSMYINSVMAAAPYKDPKVMMYWVFESPNYKYFTGDLFKEAFRQGLIATGVSGEKVENPNESDVKKEFIMPYLQNHTKQFSENKLKGHHVNIHYLGNGSTIVSQYPKPNESVMEGQNVFLLTNESTYTMPDMRGWSRKDIMTFADLTNLPITMDGYGFVYEQNIQAGTVIEKESEIVVHLK